MPNGDEGEGKEETWAMAHFVLMSERESSCVAV